VRSNFLCVSVLKDNCEGKTMSQDDIVQIKVDKHSVGIMGFNDVMEEMAGQYTDQSDTEMMIELLNRLSKKN